MEKLYCTLDWSWEKLATYLSDIHQAFLKLQKRFPQVYNAAIFWQELYCGEKILFLILDHQQCFVAFVTVSLILDLKQIFCAQICDFAGAYPKEMADIISQFECWARQNNIKKIISQGRIGWAKLLLRQNYKITSIKFEKDI